MSNLLQRCFCSGGRVRRSLGGFAPVEERVSTPAQTHDSSDATYDSASSTGDQAAQPPALDYAVEYDHDAFTGSGTIDLVRVYLRSQASGFELGNSLSVLLNNTERGAVQHPGQALTTVAVDLTTDFNGAAWTIANFNLRKVGFAYHGLSADPNGVGLFLNSEIAAIEVWGTPQPGTYSPSRGPASALPDALVLTDGYTGQPVPADKATLRVAEQRLHSRGFPYFAAVQNASLKASPFGGDEHALTLVFAIDSAPVQLASPDEEHILLSYHETGASGRELFWLGVTPNGRLVGGTRDSGSFSSPAGAVPFDGSFHVAQLSLLSNGPQRELSLDGRVLIAQTFTGFLDQPITAGSGRFMLFNGRKGLTRCACTIGYASAAFEDYTLEWPVNDGTGATKLSYLENDTPSRGDFGLDLQWYDPATQGWPQAWGSPNTDDPKLAYAWDLETAYTRRDPYSPVYTRRGEP